MSYQYKKIVDYTWKLQTQTTVPLWSLADAEVILELSCHLKPNWGNTSKKTRSLIAVSKKIKAVDFFLFIIGFIRAFSMWRHVKNNSSHQLTQCEKVFIGFGAASEDHLYDEFKQQFGESLLYINLVNYVGMEKLARPNLFKIVLALYKNAFGHSAKLKNAIPEILENETDFLTVCARNIGAYAFFSVYWKNAALRGIKQVFCLAPDMYAFACVKEKIDTVFVQHGLMAFGILMPPLQKIHVLTEIEERYLKNLFPAIEIKKVCHPIQFSKNNNNTVIILSPNTFLAERLSTIESFVLWCKKNNMKIVIRPTNRVTENELSRIQKQYPNCMMDNIKIPIHKSLENWQPKLVAAWTSTGLALALEYGFLPISFCDPDYEWLHRSIYPLGQRVLFWPDDRIRMEEAITSSECYVDQVLQLRNA